MDYSTPAAPQRHGLRREVLAWAAYDWANSAYSTILITVVFRYLTTVVFAADNDWGPTAYAFTISASMMVAAVLSPIVGAMADQRGTKRWWLAGTAIPGALLAIALAAVPAAWTATVIALFFCVSLCFEISLGIYNAFLPEIADEEEINRVSALGFALGYLGGAVALAGALALAFYGKALGVPEASDQLRLGIALMGAWWGVFSLPAIVMLRDSRKPVVTRPSFFSTAAGAVREVGTSIAHIRRYRILALFLLGFLFYNEGVQTVISQASTFATKSINFTTTELILVILAIQVMALPGALLIGRLSDRLGQKPTLFGCLAIWIALLVGAFFVHTKGQFWILAATVAMVMGGTQSVSRAIMGTMTPKARSAEFFGFFNLSGKATSFMGPFLFGAIYKATSSPRMAIVSLLVFFIVGWLIVARIDIHEGRRQAHA